MLAAVTWADGNGVGRCVTAMRRRIMTEDVGDLNNGRNARRGTCLTVCCTRPGWLAYRWRGARRSHLASGWPGAGDIRITKTGWLLGTPTACPRITNTATGALRHRRRAHFWAATVAYRHFGMPTRPPVRRWPSWTGPAPAGTCLQDRCEVQPTCSPWRCWTPLGGTLARRGTGLQLPIDRWSAAGPATPGALRGAAAAGRLHLPLALAAWAARD